MKNAGEVSANYRRKSGREGAFQEDETYRFVSWSLPSSVQIGGTFVLSLAGGKARIVRRRSGGWEEPLDCTAASHVYQRDLMHW